MRGLAILVTLALTLGAQGPAPAHHVGTVTPKDTEVSANFKQVKSSVQAAKFDAALKLFDEGALRAEMKRLERRLPAGLEERLRAALQVKDTRGAEVRLMVFMLFIARDFVREAELRLADAKVSQSARIAGAWKLLEAVWRYYGLVDFAVYQRDVKAALGMRLAFDDAEGAVCGGGSDPMKVGGNPCGAAPGFRPAGGALKGGVNLVKAKEALGRMTEILTRVIEEPVKSGPAVPAGSGPTRP
jgi:hypothetical protein